MYKRQVDIQHIRTEVTESGYQVSILASSAAGIKDYSFDGGETWQESYTTVMEQLPYEMAVSYTHLDVYKRQV